MLNTFYVVVEMGFSRFCFLHMGSCADKQSPQETLLFEMRLVSYFWGLAQSLAKSGIFTICVFAIE